LSLLKSISAVMRALILTGSVLLAWNPVLAQSSTSPPGQSPRPATAGAQSQTAPQGTNPLQSGVVLIQLLKRKSVVFPDIATDFGRLNGWQKFQLAANNSVALSTIAAALLASGYGQAVNSPAGYGQGGEGYAKRFGALMGRAASYNIFGNFVIASAVHEDPRFYVKKNLSFMQSVKYGAVRMFAAQSDSGEQMVDFAGLLGPMAGEALANTYYPKGARGVGDAFVRYGSDQGWRFAGNMLRQYWPRINRKLRLAPPEPEPTRAANSPAD